MNVFKLKEDGSILTPEFRVSFPNMFEKSQLSGKYGCGMMFPKATTDMSVLDAKLKAIILEKWGNKTPKGLGMPTLDGDESDRAEREGYWYINGKAGQYKAPLVDRDKDEITDPEDFYAGCWARAVITFYTYDRKDVGKKGCSVGIRSVQKLRDDEPLVSRVVVENEFDDLPDGIEEI